MLSAHQVLALWEWGSGRHPVDRGLVLLHLAYPEIPEEELAGFSLGRRNRLLLQLWRDWVSPALGCFVRCPQCRAELEFEVRVDELLAEAAPGTADAVILDGRFIPFRVLESRDQAAVVGLPRDLGRRRLLERCLDGVGEPLTDELVVALEEALLARDPLAELRLQLDCAECTHDWSAGLDILAFHWLNLSRSADRLLREVDTLARAYSWPEDVILSLSPLRRQSYLGMLAS